MSQAPETVTIAVAPNGARKSQRDHPRLPITPAELAQCAADCAAAGASMLHLHVRDASGRHSLDPADYRPAIEAIRERVGDALLLQLTTESGGRYAPREQMASMDALAPEALSIAIRELFADAALHAEVAAFLARLAARGALVQYIVYSADDVARAVRLQAEGAIPQAAPQLLFVLGAYAEGRAGRPADLLPMLAALPTGWPWSACAFGSDELRCVVAAALLGGHVRVGFENNLLLPSGAVAADNAALIGVTRDALHALGMRQSTLAETRRFLRGA
jgi:3-keto-5-aminohexanoate cleavage enzyme